MIRTVSGEILSADLGRTLLHEHLAIGLDGWQLAASKHDSDREGIVAQCVRKLATLTDLGVRSIVDATTIEMGRDPALMRDVSMAAGVNILSVSGVYAPDFGVPTLFRRMRTEALASFYEKELTVGVADTGILTAALKLASDAEPNDLDSHLLSAVAIAHRATRAPIITHTAGTRGDWQARELVQQGVDPRAVVVGHLDHKWTSFKYLDRIGETGVYLGFDRIGHDAFLDEESRVRLVMHAIERFGVDRVVISMDSWAHWLATEMMPEDMPVTRSRGYDYLSPFLKALRSRGITDQDIETLLVANPRRLLDRAGTEATGRSSDMPNPRENVT